MPRPLRVTAGLLVAIAVIGVATYLWKNPETKKLDEAARAGATGQFVRLSEGVTHYQVNGPDTGRVVILAHGASVPLYIWDSTAVALSNAGYRVIRYDRFGFGYSDRPDAAYDSTMFVKQLDELADSLKLTTPFDLMGLSFGGFVGGHYVKAHPNRVRTLTLVDPAASSVARPWVLRTVSSVPLLRDWFWQVLIVPKAANGQPGDFLHPEHFADWVDRYKPQMAFKGLGRAMNRTNAASSPTDYQALYGAVGKSGVPVLLVWGKQDPVVAFSFSDSVRKAIPSAEFVAVDSSGHLPHMEQSALVREKMLAFLAAHPGPPR